MSISKFEEHRQNVANAQKSLEGVKNLSAIAGIGAVTSSVAKALSSVDFVLAELEAQQATMAELGKHVQALTPYVDEPKRVQQPAHW